MPTDVTVALQGASNLPKDRFVNVLHFEGDDFTTGLMDELWSKYQAFITAAVSGLTAGGHVISCYRPGPNPTGPYAQKTYTSAAGGTGGSGPTELALCLSYATVDNPDQAVPRRRGRIYLGPFQAAYSNAARPVPTLRDAVLDLGEGIAQVGTASNITWSMYSKTDASYHKIESIWCDDAWDIQRRRGLAPSLRETRDVQ